MFKYTDLLKENDNVLNFNDDFVGSQREFTAMIKNYEVCVSSRGTAYVTGTLQNNSVTCGFKIWESALVTAFDSNKPVGKAIKVLAKAADYKGTHEWHIVEFKSEPSTDISAIMPCVPNLDELWQNFCNRINSLPVEWQKTINYAFHGVDDKDLMTMFKLGWGGAKVHDARTGGLLAHTMKMLNIFDALVANDSRLAVMSDIMQTAIILHDLGKVEEMVNGVYQPNSFVHHPQRIGVYLGRWQKEIITEIGEDNYYRLMSAVLGHHGGLGGDSEPTTIYAYILHLIDLLEAHTTSIMDQLGNSGSLKLNSTGEPIVWHNEFKLFV